MKIERDLETEDDEMIIEVANVLIENAKNDPLIAQTLDKENKSLSELSKYLVSEAQKCYKKKSNGGIGIRRETVFGWAQHYYDEDDIMKKGKDTSTAKEREEVTEIELPKDDLDVFDL